MERRYQNERLSHQGQAAAVLGRAFHQARAGCHQEQEFGDEEGGQAARRLLRHALRKVSRNLRLLEASLPVGRGFLGTILKFNSTFLFRFQRPTWKLHGLKNA